MGRISLRVWIVDFCHRSPEHIGSQREAAGGEVPCLFHCLFHCLFVCLFVCLSACLFVCLFVVCMHVSAQVPVGGYAESPSTNHPRHGDKVSV